MPLRCWSTADRRQSSRLLRGTAAPQMGIVLPVEASRSGPQPSPSCSSSRTAQVRRPALPRSGPVSSAPTWRMQRRLPCTSGIRPKRPRAFGRSVRGSSPRPTACRSLQDSVFRSFFSPMAAGGAGEIRFPTVASLLAAHGRGRGSESGFFGLRKARGNRRPAGAGFRWEGCLVREATSFPGSSSLGLKPSQAKQGQPVRMALTRHQLPRAFAPALGMSAAHEAAVVQEEPQQVEIRAA